jgi:hypothetical protein
MKRTEQQSQTYFWELVQMDTATQNGDNNTFNHKGCWNFLFGHTTKDAFEFVQEQVEELRGTVSIRQ